MSRGREGFCCCDGPMPVPDETGQSPIDAMCFGCDLPMDEVSTVGLYDDPVTEDTEEAAAAHERAHHEPGGVHAMNLIQLTEMLCNWIAATRRHEDGDIHRSIDQNAERFGYGEELTRLLHGTVDGILARELPQS